MTRNQWYWLAGGVGAVLGVLLVGYKMGSDQVGVAVAQTGSGGNQCYTQLYNADGTKNGSAAYYPCAPSAPMWTLNQAQRTTTITPGAATFAPTKAVMIGSAASCNIALQLVNDTAPTTWQNVQPGTILPVQAIAIPAAGTTCTPILALY